MIDRLPPKIQRRIEADPESECWLWTGALTPAGYGQIELAGRRHLMAHRLVADLLDYPLGENMHHRETCPKRCVNPDHLTPLTIAEHARHHTTERTHCVHGHEFTPENTYHRPDGGGRQCRRCTSDRYLARKARRA